MLFLYLTLLSFLPGKFKVEIRNQRLDLQWNVHIVPRVRLLNEKPELNTATLVTAAATATNSLT